MLPPSVLWGNSGLDSGKREDRALKREGPRQPCGCREHSGFKKVIHLQAQNTAGQGEVGTMSRGQTSQARRLWGEDRGHYPETNEASTNCSHLYHVCIRCPFSRCLLRIFLLFYTVSFLRVGTGSYLFISLWCLAQKPIYMSTQ